MIAALTVSTVAYVLLPAHAAGAAATQAVDGGSGGDLAAVAGAGVQVCSGAQHAQQLPITGELQTGSSSSSNVLLLSLFT